MASELSQNGITDEFVTKAAISVDAKYLEIFRRINPHYTGEGIPTIWATNYFPISRLVTELLNLRTADEFLSRHGYPDTYENRWNYLEVILGLLSEVYPLIPPDKGDIHPPNYMLWAYAISQAVDRVFEVIEGSFLNDVDTEMVTRNRERFKRIRSYISRMLYETDLEPEGVDLRNYREQAALLFTKRYRQSVGTTTMKLQNQEGEKEDINEENLDTEDNSANTEEPEKQIKKQKKPSEITRKIEILNHVIKGAILDLMVIVYSDKIRNLDEFELIGAWLGTTLGLLHQRIPFDSNEEINRTWRVALHEAISGSGFFDLLTDTYRTLYEKRMTIDQGPHASDLDHRAELVRKKMDEFDRTVNMLPILYERFFPTLTAEFNTSAGIQDTDRTPEFVRIFMIPQVEPGVDPFQVRREQLDAQDTATTVWDAPES